MRTRNKRNLITVFSFLRRCDLCRYKIKEMVLLGLYMFQFRCKLILQKHLVDQKPQNHLHGGTFDRISFRVGTSITENSCQRRKYLFKFYNKDAAGAFLNTAVVSTLLTLIRQLLNNYVYTGNRNHIQTNVLTQMLQ